MIIDHDQWVDAVGLRRQYYTEPGRDGRLHTWDIADQDGYGLSLRAQQRDDLQLSSKTSVWTFINMLVVALNGTKVELAFELDRIGTHVPRRNGFCATFGHSGCSAEFIRGDEATEIWARISDRFHPVDDEVFGVLAEELQRRWPA